VDLQRNFNIYFDFAIEKDCWISHEVMINHRSGSRDLFMLFQHFSPSVVFTAITLVNIPAHTCIPTCKCCSVAQHTMTVLWFGQTFLLKFDELNMVKYYQAISCVSWYMDVWICAKFLHIFLPGCCHTTVLTYSNVCWSSWFNVPKFVTLESQTVDRPFLSKKLTTFQQPGVDNFQNVFGFSFNWRPK